LAKPVVFDSTAILAILFDEPGAEKLIGLLQQGLLSSVSLAEIYSRLLLAGRPAAPAWDRVLSMGFEVVHFSSEHARLAGGLMQIGGLPRKTRSQTLSLAERACLALAIERDATVYTTNHAWKNLPGIASSLDIVIIA